jgi:uncharacterized protein (DUF2141 family)
MKISFHLYFIVLSFLLLPKSGVSQNTNVSLEFTNLRTSKGHIRIGLYDTEDSFKKEKAFLLSKILKTNLVNNSFSAQISLPIGEYGISVLDDENGNAVMDYNMIKMPKEGFGFSNYYHSGFTKPKLSQFLVSIKERSNIVKIKFRYI